MNITRRDLENLTCIFTGRHSLLYFQEASDDTQPIVLKILRDDSVTSREIEHLANEHVVTKELTIQGIRRSLDYCKIDGRPTLVLEYVEGASLHEECEKERMNLSEILLVSISIVQTLSELHRHKIVHRNISSANLLVNRKNMTTTIIDFGIAMEGGPRSANQKNLEALDGSYHYISPEQSGRINRSMDFRTDLYSFGVVMYEMLAGRLPFVSSDPLELIHFHIAGDPEPLCKLDPTIPRVLSDLVMKLMSKNSEDRYQSAHGLKVDLENCLGQLKNNGIVTPFQLAKEDFREELRLTHKLYGRKSEFQVLTNALGNASNGMGEIVLVSGEAGVGKSSLVDEIKLIVAEKGGYFLTAAGDVYRQNTPHYVLLQAFGRFVDMVLTESTGKLLQWKEEIRKALGKNATLLIDAIPRLELIIGRQPATQPLESTEFHARLQNALQEFVRLIARRERLLVLFVDNLQWVDMSSLSLLSSLLSGIKHQYLLFIGAYRGSEVEPSHPVKTALENLEGHEAVIRKLHLSNLTRKTLNNLVADALGTEPSGVQTLSDIIHAKTAGSPIFALWFLQSLSESNLLAFDPATRSWKWDGDQIRTMNIADNLVALMTREIRQLPREAQELLSRSACIGNRFDLKTLSIIAEQPLSDTRKLLEPAIEKGLIEPLNQRNSLPEGEAAKENDRYQFPHVRVRQAAHGLMARKLSRTVHLRIGRLRMQNKPIAELGERIFGIADHFNEGFQEIKERPEKLTMVELNLAAGRKAQRGAAYKEAIWYFSMGLGMLPTDKWENHYDLCESLYLEAMEAEYLCSNVDRAELLCAELLKHARDETAKTMVHTTMEKARAQSLIRIKALGKEPTKKYTSPLTEVQNRGADIAREASLLDVNTVIKASQAIAGEIELDRLLAKTMRIVIENAGAEKGFLIENSNDKLLLQAKGEIGQDHVETMQEIPIEKSGTLPLSVIYFVARTQTPVVLNDAFHDSVFGVDGHIVKQRTKSLLCIPIVHKGALSGVLYLENNLATDVFTPDRLELLKVLSAQAAISMENARLYASHKKSIENLMHAEEALRKSEKFLDSIVENIPAMIFVKDAEQLRFVKLNKAGEELLGFSRDELIGKNDYDFFPKEQATFFTDKDRNVLRSRHLCNIPEEPIQTRSGKRILHTQKIPLLDSSGEPQYLLGISEDITERKRNEAINISRLHLIQFAEKHSLDEFLEETVNEAEKLTGSLIAFYCFVDVDQEILTPQSWSTRTKAEFGKAKGKGLHYATGDAAVWLDCLHQQKPVIHNDFASLTQRMGIPQGHTDVVRALGVPVLRGEKVAALLGLGNKPTDYDEKDVEMVSLLADLAWEIAERKRAEEALRRLTDQLEQHVRERTVQLELSNKELESFAYSVSHDLRAPLRHIDGFIELLKEKGGTPSDEQSQRYMNTISVAARKMGLLIDNLLSFSRMGRHAMSFQRVELGSMVREVIQELEPDTAGRDIKWRIGDLPTVSGDVDLLRMVLTNLIANGLKFTRTRQQAHIEIGSLPDQEAEAVIFVRDNGVGFDMLYADKLFGVFQRLHRADEFEGTGIGLAHVRRIIARHGGRTWAEGKINRGAVFFFSLPATTGGKNEP